MIESGYYPPGAEHDLKAPYNQKEGIECSVCQGAGELEDEDYIECHNCNGTGIVS